MILVALNPKNCLDFETFFESFLNFENLFERFLKFENLFLILFPLLLLNILFVQYVRWQGKVVGTACSVQKEMNISRTRDRVTVR